jgi:uncharacterized OB-fold protein
MDFKKCARCGSFFVSDNNVCCNCESKDRADIYKLSNYISEEIEAISVNDLSMQTGVNANHISRFIESNSLPNLNIKS